MPVKFIVLYDSSKNKVDGAVLQKQVHVLNDAFSGKQASTPLLSTCLNNIDQKTPLHPFLRNAFGLLRAPHIVLWYQATSSRSMPPVCVVTETKVVFDCILT